jgi:hypothetical protein
MTPGLQPSTSKISAYLGRCPRLVLLRAFSPQLVRKKEIIDLATISLLALHLECLFGGDDPYELRGVGSDSSCRISSQT